MGPTASTRLYLGSCPAKATVVDDLERTISHDHEGESIE
jgi:hypothetical protein